MTGKSQPSQPDIRTTEPSPQPLSWLTWEMLAYIALGVIALALRLWGLGARAMSHDESLHALYSWKLYAGQGYVHDPMMHGPFLFHANALIYSLFGVSDFTTRLVPALFGTALVVLPYFLRQWMGRGGAFFAAVILTVSPSFLYYARYIRNDIYIAVWSVLMAIGIFGFLSERKAKYIYLFGMAAILSIATKEVAYITGFIFVTFVVIALFWESLSERTARLAQWIGASVGVAGLALAVWLTQKPRLVTSAAQPRTTLLQFFVLLVLFFVAAVLAGLAWRRDSGKRVVLDGLCAIRLRPVLWTLAGVAVVFVLLYTTFFTNPRGLITGSIEQITYWLEQHDVQRGGQPWYFYFILMPMYEFLPLLGAVSAIIYYAFIRKKAIPERDALPFVPFLIFWTVMATALYSWAGEKMGWLILHPVLPMILLTGRLLQDWLGDLDWAAAWKKGAAGIIVMLPIAVYTLVKLATMRPFASMSIQSFFRTSGWLAGALIAVVLFWGLYMIARRLTTRQVLQTSVLTVFVVLFLLTLRFSWMANYVNYDTAKEFIVYAHGTPDIKLTMNEIAEISQRLNGDNSMTITYDGGDLKDRDNPLDDCGGLAWPLEWYFRDFPNRHYYQYWDGGTSATPEMFTVPVVLVDSCNESKVKGFLGDKYYRFPTENWRRLVWWPIEDYKGLTVNRILAALRDPVKRGEIWDIVWFRKYKHPLSDWPYVHNFALYLRKDIANLMWQYGAAPTVAPPPEVVEEDPYAGKQFLTPSLLSFGELGSAPGQFTTPRDVAADAEGNIYVIDTGFGDSGNHRVQVFDPQGNFLREWGSRGSEPGQFNEPWGIAVDAAGNVYVADTWNHRIQKFDSDGTLLTLWGTYGITDTASDRPGEFYGPRDIAFAKDGTVLVVDTGNKRVQRFTPDGQFVAAYGGFGSDLGQFSEPVGIAVDGDGFIYVADTWNRRIQKFAPDFGPVAAWEVRTWKGESIVNKPYLAVDSQGNVYASDPEGHRILEFSSQGEFIAAFGEYGSGPDRFNLPMGLAVDGNDNLIVADSDNHRIMKFGPIGR